MKSETRAVRPKTSVYIFTFSLLQLTQLTSVASIRQRKYTTSEMIPIFSVFVRLWMSRNSSWGPSSFRGAASKKIGAVRSLIRFLTLVSCLVLWCCARREGARYALGCQDASRLAGGGAGGFSKLAQVQDRTPTNVSLVGQITIYSRSHQDPNLPFWDVVPDL